MVGIPGKSGGSRVGAGRPFRKAGDPRKSISITLPESLITDIDKKRKKLTRSEFIENKLKD